MNNEWVKGGKLKIQIVISSSWKKKLISKYFEHISQDTGKFCFGISDTLKALEMGAVETLIVYENLDTMRYQLKNAATGEESDDYGAQVAAAALLHSCSAEPREGLELRRGPCGGHRGAHLLGRVV